jgi:general stress protein YciG
MASRLCYEPIKGPKQWQTNEAVPVISPTFPRRASEAGKKGGEHSHGGQQSAGPHNQHSGERGGSGNFADDRQRASEARKKGGERSHGSR